MNLDRLRYKAKDLEGRWVYAELAIFQESECYMRWVQDNKNLGAIAEIDLDTLCQSTGIKDSNGKLIYEHDFIRVENKNGKSICKNVEICCNGWVWTQDVYDKEITLNVSVLGLDELYSKGEINIYVIGNRYDIGGGQCPE